MLYSSEDEYHAAERKALFLFGMSGVGKTRIAGLLRHSCGWYHYSVDYRIGTRYLGEHISDSLRRMAMAVPALSKLLRSDSIVLRSNLSFANLTPLSEWIGAPGNPEEGGLSFEEYLRRQRLHRDAEIAAIRDCDIFIERAKDVYGYDCFVCDSSGSVCEVTDPEDTSDSLFANITRSMLPVYIRAGTGHRDKLLRRFALAPKPMYFNEQFLRHVWADFLGDDPPESADPTEFLRYAFSRLLDWRIPRYESLARKWAVTIDADRIAAIDSGQAFEDALSEAIQNRVNQNRAAA